MNLLLDEHIDCVITINIGEVLITGTLGLSYNDVYTLEDGEKGLFYFKAHKVDIIHIENENLQNFKLKQEKEREIYLNQLKLNQLKEELEIIQICDTDDFNPFDYKEEE